MGGKKQVLGGANLVVKTFIEKITGVSEWSKEQMDTGMYAISNMLGSMSYLYGDR